MNNPWAQGILCSLIAATLYGGISWYFRSGYPTTLLLVGVSVSTVVFSFGNILEPAVKLLLEGESPYWSLLMAFREYAPGYLVLGFFVGGLLPGIVTGLMVVKGDSLIRRLQYALFWSPISLSFFDAIAYVLLWQSDIIELRALANWGMSISLYSVTYLAAWQEV